MENLVNKIQNKKFVKDFGITEVFFYCGELCITSMYDILPDNRKELEEELKAYNN